MKNLKETRILGIVSVGIVAAWVLFAIYGSDIVLYQVYSGDVESFSASDALEAKGQAGDSFGSFGALFSALSAVLFGLSFYFQFKKDGKQKFENHFFQLLSGHRAILDSTVYYVKMDGGVFPVGGKPAFYHMYGKLKKEYEIYSEHHKKNSKGALNDTKEIAARAAFDVTKKYSSELQHYFRNMYYIFDYIDKNDDLSSVDKRFYSSLFRAQISSYELAFLFYNGLTVVGEKKFKALIEKYSVLRNIDEDMLFDRAHRNFYADSAYWGEEQARKEGLLKD